MARVLITGAAGFIGYHTALRLLARGYEVLGLDNLNDYYDVGLKRARLALLQQRSTFQFEKLDLTDRGVSGRLVSVTLIGSDGTKTVSGEVFRTILNAARPPADRMLRSTLFDTAPIP